MKGASFFFLFFFVLSLSFDRVLVRPLPFSFFASLLIEGQLIQERISLSKSKFFSLQLDSNLSFGVHGSKYEISKIVVLSTEMTVKQGSVSIHLG